MYHGYFHALSYSLLITMGAILILGFFQVYQHDPILKFLKVLNISSFDFLTGVPLTWL